MSDRSDTGGSRKRSVDDESVARELRVYQAALEAGDDPDRARILELFPELADELAGCLDGLDLMYRVAPHLHEGAADEVGIGPAAAVGDFRILREVGRGGMGVVYEAEQISLDRRVALKVLPFAAVLDARYLRRFKNEAQAAAHLHHTNIVPVHAVGSERGVHYYAMQFIEGPTLAGLIDELKSFAGNGKGRDSSPALEAIAAERTTESPRFCRAVAHLGIQAAEALDYAHESGVIHRDIKPPNLIVDEKGHLWITDFGLASTRSDTGLTMTGDIVGTLRYMSPEQALGKRVPVDHRTDIYSLAVTLYELLTLEQAFPGDDQAAVIRNLASREPTRPRALNRATPAELETILRKAMARESVDRYATAQELADDLRRFLEDRPIHARRPSILKRTVQWLRRHTTVVWAAGAVLVLAVIGLIAGNIIVARERDDAATARDDAKAAARELEVNYLQMHELVDDMVARVAGELAHKPQAEQLRKELLEKALAFYLALVKRGGDRPKVRYEVAYAYLRVGHVYGNLGRHAESEQAHRRSIEILEADDLSDTPRFRDLLADNLLFLADAISHSNRHAEAERLIRRAQAIWENEPKLSRSYVLRQIATCKSHRAASYFELGRLDDQEAALRDALKDWEQLVKDEPDYEHRFGLAKTMHALAIRAKRADRFGEAEDLYKRLMPVLEDLSSKKPLSDARRLLGNAWRERGGLLHRMGRLEESEQALEESLPILDEMARAFPSNPDIARSVAVAHSGLGLVYQGLARPAEAKSAFSHALRTLNGLASKSPDDPRLAMYAAGTHISIADVLASLGEDAAEENYARGAELLEALESDLAADPQYWEFRATAYDHWACFTRKRGKLGRAIELSRRAVAIAQRLATDYRDVPSHRLRLGACHSALGMALLWSGRPREAEKDLERAVELLEEFLLPDTPPGVMASARPHLAKSLSDWGTVCIHRGAPKRARELLRRSLGLDPNNPGTANSLSWLLATTTDPGVRNPEEAVKWAECTVEMTKNTTFEAAALNTLGVALYHAGQWKGAVQALKRSIELGSFGQPAVNCLFLAMAHWKLGDKKQAHAWYRKAVEWMDKQPSKDPQLASFRAEAKTLLSADD
jgi:serine/threonine protein kinase